MNKTDRLHIEELARAAINDWYGFSSVCSKEQVAGNGPTHEFDIFEQDKIIGGVTTATYKTSNGNSNTGGRDRVVAELFWLNAWKGEEQRVIVLTCPLMSAWLYNRVDGIGFPKPVSIFHFDIQTQELVIEGIC